MSKHTRGPWKVSSAIGAIFDAEGRPIMTGGRNDGAEPWANARLITAAPELLEALKLQQLFMKNLMAKGNVDWGRTCGIDFGLMNEALIAQDTAILKAEEK